MTTASSPSVPPYQPLPAGALPPAVEAVLEQAVDLVRHDRPADARLRLLSLWHQLAGDTDPLARCAVANDLAELQVRPQQQLDWHLRALDAADELDRSQPIGDDGAVTFGMIYPQMQLSVADAYRRLGEACGALEHLQLARTAAQGLPPGLRTDVHKLAQRIDSDLDRQSRFLPGDEDDEPWDSEHFWDDEDEWDADPAQGQESPAPRWLVETALAAARRAGAQRAAAERQRTAGRRSGSTVRRPR